MQLSHTISLADYCLAFIEASFPQLRSACAIASYPNGGLHISELNSDLSRTKDSQFEHFIEKYTTGWYHRDETPLGARTATGQIKLEGELERDFLLIKHIKNNELDLSLLLQFSPFVLSTKQYMSAAEKKLIELSIQSMLEQSIALREKDADILRQLAQNSSFQLQEIAELQAKLDQRNKDFSTSLRQLLKLLLAELEQELKIEIIYDQSFVGGLGSFQGDFEELEKRLSKQVQLLANLALLNKEHKISLTKSHLKQLLKSKSKSRKSYASKASLGRLAKASSLLDRYETAAELVRDEGLSIIGKHIGLHCKPAISNAAITDALGKNAKKIYELFQQFPDRWPIIRTEFRSIANIIEKESQRAQRVS